MSYQIILDILGATILGGTSLLCLRSFQREDLRSKQESHDDFIDRQNLAAFITLMKEDLRRNGYRTVHEPLAAPVVTRADDDCIPSRTGLITSSGAHGDPGARSAASLSGGQLTTSIITRDAMTPFAGSVGDRDVSTLGATYFDFKYHRYSGDPVDRPTDPSQVKAFDGIELTLRVKNQQQITTAKTDDALDI